MSTRVSKAELLKSSPPPWWLDDRLSLLWHYGLRAAKPLVLVAGFLWLSMLWNLPVDLRDFDAQAISTNWPALLLPALAAVALNASFVDGIALEILLLTFAIALIPSLRQGPAAVVLRHGVAVVTLLLVVLCLTDLGVRMVLGRPFAPLLDLGIYANVVDLQKGSFKGITGWFLTAAQLVFAAFVYLSTLKVVQMIQRVTLGRRFGPVTLVITGSLILYYALAACLPESRIAEAHDRLIDARASSTVWKQIDRSRKMFVALGKFEKAVDIDQFPELPPHQLLSGLGDVDVLLAFFESYGRSALKQERFQRYTIPALESFGTKLKEKRLGQRIRLSDITDHGRSVLACPQHAGKRSLAGSPELLQCADGDRSPDLDQGLCQARP